ncbi:DUF6884 domain-containing protein [Nocardia sp. NPDC052566]|uniref:DUF6884 domain-containing protein n=1 Tax=Nocardia sp. NPDC052566 TaxID=3364330 RepID=UPI0037CBA1A8
MSTSPLVISSCGARKAPAACSAGSLYTGSYARMCLRAARALAADSDIRILSARHGLLGLDREVQPYDTRLSSRDAITADRLRAQAADDGLLHRPVIVLAGSAYTALVRQVWTEVTTPLAGLPGMGAHLARLADIATTKALS